MQYYYRLSSQEKLNEIQDLKMNFHSKQIQKEVMNIGWLLGLTNNNMYNKRATLIPVCFSLVEEPFYSWEIFS